MTIGEWIIEARERLKAADIESYALEAQLLAAHVLLVDRTWLFAHPQEPFPELAGESVLQRRLAQEPLAYILGKREFFGRMFCVDRSVLIPRQDTETLVQAALDLGLQKVLDLGTGSGCIAITLKLECPGLEIAASDLSESTLALASRNADELGADIRFVRSDAFRMFDGEQFDLIVSNPPYVGSQEVLPREVDQFEPHKALYSGSTGLEFYERIADEAPPFIAPLGALALEVGYRQSAQVVELFRTKRWSHRQTCKDLSGVERVVIFSPPS